MLGFERKAEIIELLEKAGKVEVAELSEKFNVCGETIRRDLRELEKDSFLKRTHGGAVLNTSLHKPAAEFPLAVRQIRNYDEKTGICRTAASMIMEDDTIFVDNSSTTIYLLRYIPRSMHICIITNSIKVLLEAIKLRNNNLHVICLGGELKESNMSLAGTIPLKVAREYYPNKAFLSCAGINEWQMFTDSSAIEVETKKLMIEQSQTVFILADHTKFTRKGQVFLSDFSSVDHIITDDKTDLDSLGYLKKYSMEITVASKVKKEMK